MTEPKKRKSYKDLKQDVVQQGPETTERIPPNENIGNGVGVTSSDSSNTQNSTEDQATSYYKSQFGDEIVRQVFRLVDDSIKSITMSQAYFTENRLIKRVLNMAQKEIDRVVLENDDFEPMVRWAVSIKPLVTVGQTGTLTTHEMWDMENKIVTLGSEQSPLFVQNEGIVREAIARKEKISEEQIAAVEAATLSPRRISIIEGTAGAGKSFTMEAVKETYMASGYDILGTALSWNAARVLGSSAGIPKDRCLSVESFTRMLLKARASGTEPFQRPTLLIVDECCMIGTKHGYIILEETRRSRYPVKIVMTGDSKQVVPVGAGNFVEMLIEFYGTTRIDTIRRQYQDSHRNAVMSLSNRHSGEAVNTFMHQECFRWNRNKKDMLNMIVRDYVSYRLAHPDKKALVLAYSNKDVLELNNKIRAVYKKLGLIGSQDVVMKVTDGREVFESSFSVGDEVVLRSNDLDMIIYQIDETKSPLKENTWKPIGLGVNNRNSGKIVAIRRAEKPVGSYDFIIDIAGDEPCRAIINSEKFRHPEKPGLPMINNYAGTVYGSQGQTVSHVLFVDSAMMDFRMAYVGLSRHKESLDIYLDETELHRRLDKSMGKRQSLESRLAMDAKGKSIDDAVVDTGRYTRLEMLRSVALSWCKYSSNSTAIMHERRHRMGFSAIQKEDELLAKISPKDSSSDVIDFIPEYNRAYPVVDIEQILNLPDIISDAELIRPSDVENNKKNYSVTDMPVNPAETPMPTPDHRIYSSRTTPQKRMAGQANNTINKDDGFIGSALGWLSSFATNYKEKNKVVENNDKKLRLQDPVSPFAGLTGIEKEPDEDPSILEKLNAWIRPKPRADIPMHEPEPVGSVRYSIDISSEDKKLIPVLSFTGVPSAAGVEGEPDRDWLTEKCGVLWDVGRKSEPRILARDNSGNVVARYRLNGDCVVGQGFPPVIISSKAGATAPVYIVAGAKEYLWLRNEMERVHNDTPHLIPHIIWAAKDIDWSMVSAALKQSEKVVVVRTAADERQTPWAIDVKTLLEKRFGVKSIISPELDDSVAPSPGISEPVERPVLMDDPNNLIENGAIEVVDGNVSENINQKTQQKPVSAEPIRATGRFKRT